jgi:two-component system NarL family response regulator
MSDRRISILIVEDDPLLRNFVAEVLVQHPDLTVVGSLASGREVTAAVADCSPDVLLLDLHLREFSGWQVLEVLADHHSGIHALVLSGDEAPETMLQAARAGARGFLCKSAARTVLPKAVRAVAAGQTWFSPEVLGAILTDYPMLIRQAERATHPLASLTTRERAVLVRIARGLSNQQIGRELSISLSSVKAHIHRLLQKLQLQSRTEAAVFAVREGLLDAGSAAATSPR